jgi:glycosyltransferase involved in cell wall biosynthesis
MKPLITFALFAYNQERFIREALESALAQTYSPLEIIVMDDCSTDHTFEIVRRTAAEYHGPHLVKVFRNSTNLGIGGNVNRAIERCSGEFVVFAAGDDISVPSRTDIIFKAWEESGKQALGVFSSHIIISENGRERGIEGTRGNRSDIRLFRRLDGNLFRFLSTRDPMVNGCTAAWSPELFRYFGPVRSDLEDVVLSFRALAIGSLFYIHQPMVKWRRHGNNVSFFQGEADKSFEDREKQLRWVDEMTVRAFDNIIDDIKILREKGRISICYADRLKAEARRVSRRYSVERQMMDENSLQRLLTVAAAVGHGDLRCALKSAPRALPVPIYRALFRLRAKRQSALQNDTNHRI